jgi:hypothetical protein
VHHSLELANNEGVVDGGKGENVIDRQAFCVLRRIKYSLPFLSPPLGSGDRDPSASSDEAAFLCLSLRYSPSGDTFDVRIPPLDVKCVI